MYLMNPHVASSRPGRPAMVRNRLSSRYAFSNQRASMRLPRSSSWSRVVFGRRPRSLAIAFRVIARISVFRPRWAAQRRSATRDEWRDALMVGGTGWVKRPTMRSEDGMHLTPTEMDRLTIFMAAELARRRRARG